MIIPDLMFQSSTLFEITTTILDSFTTKRKGFFFLPMSLKCAVNVASEFPR